MNNGLTLYSNDQPMIGSHLSFYHSKFGQNSLDFKWFLVKMAIISIPTIFSGYQVLRPVENRKLICTEINCFRYSEGTVFRPLCSFKLYFEGKQSIIRSLLLMSISMGVHTFFSNNPLSICLGLSGGTGVKCISSVFKQYFVKSN
jgi:hypothetical protein